MLCILIHCIILLVLRVELVTRGTAQAPTVPKSAYLPCVVTGLGDKESVGVVYCDFSKAFDMVCRSICKSKLFR